MKSSRNFAPRYEKEPYIWRVELEIQDEEESRKREISIEEEEGGYARDLVPPDYSDLIGECDDVFEE